MNEQTENYQIVYYNIENCIGTSMNLMLFGLMQFKETYLYNNQDKLKALSENNNQAFYSKELPNFILNSLPDSIRVHMCFENYLKALHLTHYHVIHELDKSAFPELFKKQRKEPISFNEILERKQFQEDTRINLPTKELRLKIKGIKRILSQDTYLKKINFPSSIIEILKPYFDYRNNLHYTPLLSYKINSNSYSDFRILIDFINENLIKQLNHISEKIPGSKNNKFLNI